MQFLRKNAVGVFFAVWLLLNLMQASATELFDDEAYYWVYAKFLDWGYYDHPPMIAVLIRAGYSLFQNEFGLRLLIAVMSTATLAIIYKLLPSKNDGLFFAIACSMGLLQIGGIIAVPDIPLGFFVASFFYVYKRFLVRASFLNSVLLGLSMALMLYSKYHGVLIIIFTFASNPGLIYKRGAWGASLLGAVLFIPHLAWQAVHGWPSIHYHLFERNASEYRFSFTIEYILGQLLLAGPLMGWLLLWRSFFYKSGNSFERALKFCLVGFYGFFLLSTFKGRVEANWTIPAFVPLIILAHQSLLNNEKWKNILWKTAPLSIFLVMLARLYLMVELPASWSPKSEFHYNKIWTEDIRARAGERPVVFINSYQHASKYWFYTGVPAMSLNTPYYRRNNFNFWRIEDSLKAKQIYAISKWDFTYFTDSIETSFGLTGGKVIDSFYSSSRKNIVPTLPLLIVNQQLTPVKLQIEYPDRLYLTVNPAVLNESVNLFVLKSEKVVGIYKLKRNLPNGPYFFEMKIPLPAGKYSARFAIPTAIYDNPSLNSSTYSLEIK